MFTHLHPELNRENTAPSIRRESRVSIYRAINLRRIVAFTGSGTSSVFGLPAWSELPLSYANCVNEQIAKAMEKTSTEAKAEPEPWKRRTQELLQRIKPTLIQINSMTCDESRSDLPGSDGAHGIHFSKPYKGDVLTFIALCDKVLAELPDDEEEGLDRLYLAREAFGQTLRASEADIIREKLARALRTDVRKPDEPLLTGDAPEGAGRFLRALEYLLGEAAQGSKLTSLDEQTNAALDGILGPAEDDSFYGSELEQNTETCERDVIKVLMSHLGITRFLTLNYDVQIERQVLRDQRMVEEDEAVAFRDLCNQDKSPRPHEKRLVIESGVEKGAMSASLDQENIAEIVNFAAYSKRFARQVMHLHGRYDDPANLILTANDYRNLYEMKSIARDSFSNAQKTIFEGNDVLFVGIGMTEDEINRPLKRFLASEQNSQQTTRRAFLLYPAHSCDDCLDHMGNCAGCKAKDDAFILAKYNQLGVYSVLYGGPKYRALAGFLSKQVSAFEKLSGEIRVASADVTKSKLAKAITEARKSIAEGKLQSCTEIELPDGGALALLTQDELKLIEGIFGKLPQDAAQIHDNVPALASLIAALFQELSGRVKSRAACAELKHLKENSERWWDAWNAQPFERRAIYHMAAHRVSGQNNYLWVRHCPYSDFDGPIQPAKWKVIDAARERISVQCRRQRPPAPRPAGTETKKAARKKKNSSKRYKKNLSIARFAVERGQGQGSFVRLILQKSVQEHLFKDARPDHPGYSAAFVAHLSFSMEFASVTKALTRFLARQVAELQAADYSLHSAEARGIDALVSEELQRLNKPGKLSFEERVDHSQILKELAPKERSTLGPVFETFSAMPTGEQKLSDDSLIALAKALYISRREAEPRLVHHPEKRSFKDLKSDIERLHRLDVLAEVLAKYQELATDPKHRGSKRVFICFGGLDRLCDSDGDAHNPMHRAFFRLLTGTHEHEETDAPIDLLLLAGKPNAPICFLSETLDPKKAKKLRAHQYKDYSRHSKTKRVLHKWDRLEQFPWADRVALSPSFIGANGFESLLDAAPEKGESCGTRKAARAFINWANERDATSLSVTSNSDKAANGLHRTLWKNVALTTMLYACWEAAYTRPENPVTDINGFMQRFERRFNRDEEHGVMAEVFDWYRQGTGTDSDTDRVLQDLILRHLVLFALPVEPWVLMGCPRIYRALLQKYGKVAKKGVSDGTYPERDDWAERAWMLNRLRHVLEDLRKRAAIIRIHCSSHTEAGCNDDEMFLHHRYSLHGRVREFIAYRMQLNIFDQGDINHHQISLYCDQPKDLPTPSPLHFKMIEDILDYQRDRNRETLELTYRHSLAGRQNRVRFWDPDDDNEPGSHRKEHHSREAAIRLFAPSSISEHPGSPDWEVAKMTPDTVMRLGGSLGRMHAVSQRIRGSFSLIRSAFSVGSLSRMDAAPLTNDEAPFELYRSWLRGILNAATGVRVNNVELSGVVDATLISTPVADPKELVSMQKDIDDYAAALDKSLAASTLSRRRGKALKVFDQLGIGPLDAETGGLETNHNMIDAANDALAILSEANKIGLDRRQKSRFNKIRHPLYRDEIAWLYNERALTSMIQGRIFDAIPLFRKARDIMSHKVTPQSDTKAFNTVERRINLNYAVAKIERGKIREARLILEDLNRSSVSVPYSTPSKLVPYISGYRALCDHLGGSFETARTGYVEAIEQLWRTQDLRAVAIFKRHLSDLYRAIGDLDLAHNEIQLAINAASQAQQRDILNLAQSSRAQIYLALGKTREVEEELPQILDYADKMGLYSHKSDALMVKARSSIDAGDLGPAADAAAGSIALCTRYGLRLRKLSSLVAYGNIQYLREQDEIAQSVLQNAKAEADQIGYQLKAADAARGVAQKGRLDRPLVNLWSQRLQVG